MVDDLDHADDGQRPPERFLDISYEHEMQEGIEWLDEGPFIFFPRVVRQRRLSRSAVQLSTKRPLVVHTYGRRGENHESYAHDAHPLVALVHLLKKEAPVKSVSFRFIPFVSDFSMIDHHLAYYAKVDGGVRTQDVQHHDEKSTRDF